MKVVIPGGTGQVGGVLSRALRARGHDVVVLSRGGTSDTRLMTWDGRSVGAWVHEIDGADVVVNLAGRSVNCRYTKANLQQMMDSRVNSTRAVGLAIEQAKHPPRVWLQMSTATIYAHRYDAPNDEATGRIGGDELDAPSYWRISIDIARAWERAQQEARIGGWARRPSARTTTCCASAGRSRSTRSCPAGATTASTRAARSRTGAATTWTSSSGRWAWTARDRARRAPVAAT